MPSINLLMVNSAKSRTDKVGIGPSVRYTTAPGSPADFVAGMRWDDGSTTLKLPPVAAFLVVDNTDGGADMTVACISTATVVVTQGTIGVVASDGANCALLNAPFSASGLPISDPAVANAVYVNSNVLTVSAPS